MPDEQMAAQTPPEKGKEQSAKNVTIYTTDTWPWCHRAKEYLSQKGIPYTDINVGRDREKAKEMIQKSGQMGVPVIIVDGEVIVGFNQGKIETALAK